MLSFAGRITRYYCGGGLSQGIHHLSHGGMRMKFYCLHEGFYESVAARLSLLAASCLAEGVEFCPLDSRTVNYSNLPNLSPGDLLFNCARGSETLESLLLNAAAVTFYVSKPAIVSTPWIQWIRPFYTIKPVCRVQEQFSI